jgi:hypothetical protein
MDLESALLVPAICLFFLYHCQIHDSSIWVIGIREASTLDDFAGQRDDYMYKRDHGACSNYIAAERHRIESAGLG